MSWNYRVIKVREKIGRNSYTHYAVHEVFYDKKGKPIARSETPDELVAGTFKDLTVDYLMRAEAFCKPVIDDKDFPPQCLKTKQRKD